MKLSVAVEGYLLDKRIQFSPHTIASYERVFRRLVEFLGDVEIDQVTSADIRRFLAHLGKTYRLSRRSVHDAWIPLSSLWTWAEVELDIPHVIRGKIAAPEFTKRVIEPFTHDEIRRLIRAAEYTQEWTAACGKRTRTRRPTAKRDRRTVTVEIDERLMVVCEYLLPGPL
jgi:site-specific recombinase XerD